MNFLRATLVASASGIVCLSVAAASVSGTIRADLSGSAFTAFDLESGLNGREAGGSVVLKFSRGRLVSADVREAFSSGIGGVAPATIDLRGAANGTQFGGRVQSRLAAGSLRETPFGATSRSRLTANGRFSVRLQAKRSFSVDQVGLTDPDDTFSFAESGTFLLTVSGRVSKRNRVRLKYVRRDSGVLQGDRFALVQADGKGRARLARQVR